MEVRFFVGNTGNGFIKTVLFIKISVFCDFLVSLNCIYSEWGRKSHLVLIGKEKK